MGGQEQYMWLHKLYMRGHIFGYASTYGAYVSYGQICDGS